MRVSMGGGRLRCRGGSYHQCPDDELEDVALFGAAAIDLEEGQHRGGGARRVEVSVRRRRCCAGTMGLLLHRNDCCSSAGLRWACSCFERQ